MSVMLLGGLSYTFDCPDYSILLLTSSALRCTEVLPPWYPSWNSYEAPMHALQNPIAYFEVVHQRV